MEQADIATIKEIHPFPLVLRSISKFSRERPNLSSGILAILVFVIDIFTGKEIQFPLIYALPVCLAAWHRRQIMAYTLAIMLPVLRIGYDYYLGGAPSFAFASISIIIEIASMALYTFLIGLAVQTRLLKKRIISKEYEVEQLRIFANLAGTTLSCRGLASGLAEGIAWIYEPESNEFSSRYQPITHNEVDAENGRLDIALEKTIIELHNLHQQFAGNADPAEIALLGVHLAMLKDNGFWNKCKRRVRQDLIKVEQAVDEEIREMIVRLEGLKQEIMRERSADIRDIGRRVLQKIRTSAEMSSNRLSSLPPHTILVAQQLLPSDIYQADRANLVGIVTENNSPASHVAILARARNIPAVSDLKGATSLLQTGVQMLLDADTGRVIIAPTKAQSELFKVRNRNFAIKPEEIHDPTQQSSTKDGMRIGLFANINRADESHWVQEYKLDGVGLYRSEYLFLDVPQPPTFTEQVAAYSSMANMLNPNPIVIRTMDFGGDKIPRFESFGFGTSFRTGKRGLEFSLTEKTMFRIQIQAILRAAQTGDVRIMFPMVMGVADFREARQIVTEIAKTERLAKKVSIGAMIETPAAVMHFDELVKMVDFVSIGTNDLANFILAQDRLSKLSSDVLEFLHPSVLRATKHVVQLASEHGVDLSVCGEAAGDSLAVCFLVGMGVRNLSINPLQTSSIRGFLRQMTLKQMEAVAREALAVQTKEEVRQVILKGMPVQNGL